MNTLERTKFWLWLQRLMRFGLIVCGIMVTLIVFAATITRAISVDFRGYEEFLIAFAFWLYMFGTAHGSFENSHITADILSLVLKEGLKKDIFDLIKYILTLFIGIMFLTWAVELVNWTIVMGTKTPTWRIPMTIPQSSILFGLACATFYNAVRLYNEIKLIVQKYGKNKNAAIPDRTGEGGND
ncbi:MAG TPA: TRAP transporter small permease [Bacillota bacterium]|nr:TRAP transporter small permease [Bacillota bacterium]